MFSSPVHYGTVPYRTGTVVKYGKVSVRYRTVRYCTDRYGTTQYDTSEWYGTGTSTVRYGTGTSEYGEASVANIAQRSETVYCAWRAKSQNSNLFSIFKYIFLQFYGACEGEGIGKFVAAAIAKAQILLSTFSPTVKEEKYCRAWKRSFYCYR